MKKTVFVLLAAAVLLGAAGCGPDDFSKPGAPGQVSAGSYAGSEAPSLPVPESSQSSASHEVESDPEPTPLPEAVAEDGGDFDLLESSPYYSGQEALLQGICHASTRKPPESFLWLNEDVVREIWGIEGYVSAGCRDFVASFDFDREGEGERREHFYVSIAMFPGVDIPAPEHDGNLEYRAIEDWTQPEEHPGFEVRKVRKVYVLPAQQGQPEAALPPDMRPDEIWVRWETDGFQLMVRLPESGLDAFWENAERLFLTVDEASVEKPAYMSQEQDVSAVSAAEEK